MWWASKRAGNDTHDIIKPSHKVKRQPIWLAFTTAQDATFLVYPMVAGAGFEPTTFGL